MIFDEREYFLMWIRFDNGFNCVEILIFKDNTTDLN